MITLNKILNDIEEAKEKNRRFVTGYEQCSRSGYKKIKNAVKRLGYYNADFDLELHSAVFSASKYWMTYEIDLTDIADIERRRDKLIKQIDKNNGKHQFVTEIKKGHVAHDWFYFCLHKALQAKGYYLTYEYKKNHWWSATGGKVYTTVGKYESDN